VLFPGFWIQVLLVCISELGYKLREVVNRGCNLEIQAGINNPKMILLPHMVGKHFIMEVGEQEWAGRFGI